MHQAAEYEECQPTGARTVDVAGFVTGPPEQPDVFSPHSPADIHADIVVRLQLLIVLHRQHRFEEMSHTNKHCMPCQSCPVQHHQAALLTL
jgi:hypothetical protein